MDKFVAICTWDDGTVGRNYYKNAVREKVKKYLLGFTSLFDNGDSIEIVKVDFENWDGIRK